MLNKRSLVMFSGGKDSFLTACKRIEQGDFVGLLSFNDGCLSCEELFEYGASRLVRYYGQDKVRFEGVYNTHAILQKLSAWWSSTACGEIAKELPTVDNTQIACLHEHTAMWVAAIAYAIAKGFGVVCSGYRQDDSVCTGSILYTDALRMIAGRLNIDVEFPVWDAGSDDMSWENYRDEELISYGFYPVVLEPQCTLTRRITSHISLVAGPLSDYFEKRLRPIAVSQIPKLRETFRSHALTEHSLDVGTYEIPSGPSALY